MSKGRVEAFSDGVIAIIITTIFALLGSDHQMCWFEQSLNRQICVKT